ncbi:TatD family hydrolase, partial [Bifidobacterium pseudocatenulatum]|uniref:TatD family hydrolase n=1 Tax=Bifidobacterium pseudocatenulatum TaxID=28026 RepID=UPI00210C2109
GTSSYKGNDGIRESARSVGLSHVMVETDARYLSPMPYRGRTNAPYMIPYTLQSLANYLDKPLTEVAQATRKTT